MRNPLQEQLLKAGLVKKSKVDQVAREQAKQRQGKPVAQDDAPRVDAQRLQAERAGRDRALAAERNAQLRANELRAQVRQIVDANKLPRRGEIVYRFTAGNVVDSVLVDEGQRAQLAKGALVIVRHEPGYALIPRSAAEKVAARDPDAIVVDHARAGPPSAEDEEAYRQFPVPDDLVW